MVLKALGLNYNDNYVPSNLGNNHQMSNDLNNLAFQSHLDAYIPYKLLLADIMRKSFYDFENGRPIVQDYDF